MAAHTADSLERSLRTFSIRDYGPVTTTARHSQAQKSETACRRQRQDPIITLDLSSDTSLPYNWEQCLDLKTGEIYFINRSSGVKTKMDPWEMAEYRCEYYYSDDDGSCDYETDEEGCGSNAVKGAAAGGEEGEGEDNVLVAAGCRSCLMYYMVPRQVNDCPKCNRQLLHFNWLEESSSLAVV